MSLFTALWHSIFRGCQVSGVDRKVVEDFAYEQANLLRDEKVTREQALAAIAKRFPEMTSRQVANAVANGLFLSR